MGYRPSSKEKDCSVPDDANFYGIPQNNLPSPPINTSATQDYWAKGAEKADRTKAFIDDLQNAPDQMAAAKQQSPNTASLAPTTTTNTLRDPKPPTTSASRGKAPYTAVSAWLSKVNNLIDFRQSLGNCTGCFLGQSGAIPALGCGPVGAPIMFFVDPPNHQDIVTDCPPGGPASELLQNIITLGLRLNPQDCYITSIVKCPVEDPLNVEPFTKKSCTAIAFKEIELASPKVIIAMGITASQALCGKEDVMLRLRRMKTSLGSAKIPFRMTLGLADMLTSPELKRDVWQDLKTIMKSFTP
jgi:DNA polymerase